MVKIIKTDGNKRTYELHDPVYIPKRRTNLTEEEKFAMDMEYQTIDTKARLASAAKQAEKDAAFDKWNKERRKKAELDYVESTKKHAKKRDTSDEEDLI